MALRIFLALLLFFVPVQFAQAKATIDLDSVTLNHTYAAEQPVDEKDADELVPAKEALEKPQKSVNIILVIIFIIAGAAFVAMAVVMKRSAK